MFYFNKPSFRIAARKNHLEVLQLLLTKIGNEIPTNFFLECDKLTSITIPPSIESIKSS